MQYIKLEINLIQMHKNILNSLSDQFTNCKKKNWRYYDYLQVNDSFSTRFVLCPAKRERERVIDFTFYIFEEKQKIKAYIGLRFCLT